MNYSFPNPQFNFAGLQAICAAYPVDGITVTATEVGDAVVVTKDFSGGLVLVNTFSDWALVESQFNLIMAEGDYCGEIDAYLLAVENASFIEVL